MEDPAFPGAAARTGTASLLWEPPTDGTPWRWETTAVPDGWPGEGAVEVLNADLWHARGWRGQGVKVAVFDIQWHGGEPWQDSMPDVASADCWSHPSCEVVIDPVVARLPFEQGNHGVACAQVVQQVAPEAEVHVVRVTGFSTFESAVDWAIRHDIDVVSMSLSFFNDSFYDGTGPFDRVVRKLSAAGILLVTSSGNYARQHWMGGWQDQDGDRRLDFDGTNGLDVVFNAAGRRTIYVNWDEHFACGDSDLDAWVVDGEGFIIGRAERRQLPGEDGCDPVERVTAEVPAAGTYRLVVLAHRVSAPYLSVDVIVTGGSVAEPVAASSLVDPASHPLSFTVGAVDAVGYLTNAPEGFSSRGPSRAGVPKPDISGPDGLSVTAYGARGFFGTSASTPAVAGALALVLSRYPELTPREGSERLKAWAWSDAPHQDDPGLGAGRARLPNPEGQALGCVAGDRSALLLPVLGLWRRRRTSRPPAPEAGSSASCRSPGARSR